MPRQPIRAVSDAAWLAVLRLLLAGVVLLACGESTGPEARQTYADVVAGGFLTCALSNEGETFCWGYSDARWLSDAAVRPEYGEHSVSDDTAWSIEDWVRPRPLEGDPGFSSIAGGGSFACGLVASGGAYCWGRNERGQLGDGTSGADRYRAEPVTGDVRFSGFAALAATVHACALDQSGRAYCWGNNWRRQLGAGPDVDSLFLPVPTPVAGNHVFEMLAAGPGESCGLTATSDLYCWGADGSGLRDYSRSNDRGAPELIPTSLRFDTIGVGSSVTCGLVDGTAYCRGWNGNGVLGTGDTISRATFTPVATELRFDQVSVGRVHVCALTDTGTAYCWGAGTSGRLGNGSTETKLVPTPVAGGHLFRKLSAGGDHTCGLTTAGDIYCWGDGFNAQLGNGRREDGAVPVRIAPPVG